MKILSPKHQYNELYIFLLTINLYYFYVASTAARLLHCWYVYTSTNITNVLVQQWLAIQSTPTPLNPPLNTAGDINRPPSVLLGCYWFCPSHCTSTLLCASMYRQRQHRHNGPMKCTPGQWQNIRQTRLLRAHISRPVVKLRWGLIFRLGIREAPNYM
jgi:hypothetical protein